MKSPSDGVSEMSKVSIEITTPSTFRKTRGGGDSSRDELSLSRSKSRMQLLEKTPTTFKEALSDSHFVASSRFVILPWSVGYKTWWSLTVFCACLTVFTETYNIAFIPAGFIPLDNAAGIIEMTLLGIFCVDIVINFMLAYFDEASELVMDHRMIARRYLRRMFWVDLIGVFPFYAVLLAITGQLGQDSELAQYLGLVRFVRFVRLHRLFLAFEILQFHSKVSLFTVTMLRNILFGIFWCHTSACIFYFIARAYYFDPTNTWIGTIMENQELDVFQSYVLSLYFAVVTFATVGYGDFHPLNVAEKIYGIIYLLINITILAWIIGSTTMLIVKDDEKTGEYRESLQVVDHFTEMHGLDKKINKSLRRHIKLDLRTRDYHEGKILAQYPSAVRRKVMEKIYLPDLMRMPLLRGLSNHFVEAFLSACKVEITSPGEELLHQGVISNDLYFLVSGTVVVAQEDTTAIDSTAFKRRMSFSSGFSSGFGLANTSNADTSRGAAKVELIEDGQFINEIDFFTETPMKDTYRTKTICKTLRLSRSDFKVIAGDYPDSTAKLLNNLLVVAKTMKETSANQPDVPADDEYAYNEDVDQEVKYVQQEAAISALEELIKNHKNKLKDDHTMRFLFAASRGDTKIVSLMCETGFDANSADYDRRTALMVAAMNGHTETVIKLLEHHADPNVVDIHGSSALFEAVNDGHVETMRTLLQYGAELSMTEESAASKLCQLASIGDVAAVRRLLEAKVHVDAADYDMRTAAHLAAADGQLEVLKLLVEYGSSVHTVRDRWNNSVEDEARSHSREDILSYLQSLKKE